MSRKHDDDDDTVSKGDGIPRSPMLPTPVPERPTLPQLGRAKRARGDDELLDDGPTVYDPGVPTGAPGFPAQLGTDDEPTGAKAKVPLDTVVGKRAQKQTLKNPGKVERNVEKKVDPRELPTMRHQMPLKAEPSARIDELALTNRWNPDQLGPRDEAPMRDSGPPTNPLPPRGNEAVPVPRSGPQLPLAPGPHTAPIRAVSMKTPAEVGAAEKAQPALPQVRIRPMSEVGSRATPQQGMGYLAPPRDPNVARPKRWQDIVIWGSVVVMVAAVVTLAVWFLAR